MAKKISQSTDFGTILGLGVQEGIAGNVAQALEYFQRAIVLEPTSAKAYYNLGLAYKELGRPDLALAAYKKSLELLPDATTHTNLGIIYFESGHYLQSIRQYQKALEINPFDERAYNNLGNVMTIQGNYKQALVYFEKALSINPKNDITLVNTGIALREAQYLPEAIKSFKAALKLNSQNVEAMANLVNTCLYLLDWDSVRRFEKTLDNLNRQYIHQGKKPPESVFANLVRLDNPKVNLHIAQAYSTYLTATTAAIRKKLNFRYTHTGSKKIRIGYLTDGFRDFPTGHNIIGILENHDTSRFAVFAFSYGVDDQSQWRKRTEKATTFVDIMALSFEDSAKVINKYKIDILVDLKGHTKNSRERIPALKPAPVQVNLLGFAGSTGASYVDYFIGDKVTIDKQSRKYFSESIVYMPNTYWPTDNKLQISKRKFKREDFGLPPRSPKGEGVVFGSFNQPYKIEPDMFETWLHILTKVPKSMFMLYCPNEDAKAHLISFAKKRKFDPSRLVFVGRLSKKDHLARIRDCVDLALDTKTVNGHTTTTDCLWAGVPVVTILGRHFMSKVSASMLKAVGLPELITNNLHEYAQMAVDLATHPKKLETIRKSLSMNRKSYPLFDTSKYTKHLERAYVTMYDKYKQGKGPTDIIVR